MFGEKFTSSLSKHKYIKSPKHTYCSFYHFIITCFLYLPFFYDKLSRSLGLRFIFQPISALTTLIFQHIPAMHSLLHSSTFQPSTTLNSPHIVLESPVQSGYWAFQSSNHDQDQLALPQKPRKTEPDQYKPVTGQLAWLFISYRTSLQLVLVTTYQIYHEALKSHILIQLG